MQPTLLPFTKLLTTDYINSVEFPEDHVETLQSSEHIHVEQDKEVKTQ